MRVLAWGAFWCLSTQYAADWVLGWPWWAQALASLPVMWLAMTMSRRRSIRWRWTYLLHRPRVDERIICDEDMNLRGVVLPGENLCCTFDDDGPYWAHIHTRSVLTGREFVRARTTWRTE